MDEEKPANRLGSGRILSQSTNPHAAKHQTVTFLRTETLIILFFPPLSPTRPSIIAAFLNVLCLTLLFRPLEAVMLSGEVVCRGINCALVPSQVPS